MLGRGESTDGSLEAAELDEVAAVAFEDLVELGRKLEGAAASLPPLALLDIVVDDLVTLRDIRVETELDAVDRDVLLGT